MTARKPKDTRQWQHVRDARTRLNDAKQFPVLSELEDAWSLLSAQYLSFIADRERIESIADTPLSTLMFQIELGFYPPPELLLGLLESWREYLDAAGGKTLEESFLGKPRPKAGSYARRRSTSTLRTIIVIRFESFLKQGLTQEEAGERVVEVLGLRTDADTVARIYRQYKKDHAVSPREKRAAMQAMRRLLRDKHQTTAAK